MDKQTETKWLGAIITDALTWDKNHVEYISTKLITNINILK